MSRALDGAVFLSILLALGCSGDLSGSLDVPAVSGADGGSEDGAALDGAAPDGAAESRDGGEAFPDAGLTAPDAGEGCILGTPCNPIPIESFPFSDRRDTREASSDAIDRYECAPNLDESGPEIFYRLEIPETGFVRIELDDVDGDQIDVDLQLLGDLRLDGGACLARANKVIERVLSPGTYFLVADSWVDGSGAALAGPYLLGVELSPLTSGPCAMELVELEMYWSSCLDGASFDCRETLDSSGVDHRFLSTPAFGPVVKEAHLVTVADDFGGSWPTAPNDRIQEHYALSEAATGYLMSRTEPWAPSGEGGSQYGQGSTGVPLPVVEEGWYINMYWRQRPQRGRRMIVLNPANGRAVVAAAGYETGPGANTAVAGVAEEIHDHLGTIHRSRMVVGFAVDQSLDFGPVSCP